MIIVSSGTGTVSNINTTAPLSGGPITTSGTITTTMATNKLIGRSTAGTGVMEEITVGTGLSLSGGTLSSTGGATAAGSTNEIQFNNAAAFAASANLRWIISDNRLVLGTENTADTNSRMVIIGKGISTNNTFAVHNSTGTNNAFLVRDDGRIMTGTSTPNGSYGVTVEQNVSSSLVGISIRQLSATGNAGAAYNLISNNGNGRIIKAGGGYSSKFTKNNDLILLNDSNGGNLCLLADASSGTNQGEIQFGAGGSSTAQMILRKNGTLDINTTENASAILNVNSTTKGVLLPRLTTTEVNAIVSPATGLTVYNTTVNTLCFYNGSSWQKLSHSNL